MQFACRSAELEVEYELAHAQVPDPPTMQQDGKQIMLFTTTIQALSPYPIAKQSLSVKLPNAEIFEWTKFSKRSEGAVSQRGPTVEYKGMTGSKPFEARELELRYRHNRPFLHFLSVDRDITARLLVFMLRGPMFLRLPTASPRVPLFFVVAWCAAAAPAWPRATSAGAADPPGQGRYMTRGQIRAAQWAPRS
jgi:Ribophorin I